MSDAATLCPECGNGPCTGGPTTGEGACPKQTAASAQRTFTVPVMVCGNGHTYETVFPASFKGTPCRECGSPLRRAES